MFSNRESRKKYVVIDTENYVLKCFQTYNQALTFKIMNARLDWSIKKV